MKWQSKSSSYCYRTWQDDLKSLTGEAMGLTAHSESCSVVYDSLWPHGLWNSPGQNTGVGSLSLLQGIFPNQGSNPGLPHRRWILYQLSHNGSHTLSPPFRISRPHSLLQTTKESSLCCFSGAGKAWGQAETLKTLWGGLPQGSSVTAPPVWGAWAQSLVGELDPTCCSSEFACHS